MKAYLFIGKYIRYQGTVLAFEDGYLLPVWIQEALKEEGALESPEAFTTALLKHSATEVGVTLEDPPEGAGRLDVFFDTAKSREPFLIMHPHGAEGFDPETFLALDLSGLQEPHAHWSDPIWEFPQELQWFYFGHGEIPAEAQERWETVASRTGLATAWLIYWIEVEFGQRDEGARIYATLEDAQKGYEKDRREGAYEGGYIGPVAGAKPKEIRINWDLYDRIEASKHGYLHIEPREHDILTPL